MGNICSPSFSCDASVSLCLDCSVRKAGYVYYLQENIDALWTELQKLIEVRNDVKVRVIVAEQQRMKRLEQVQGWLLRVQDVETEVPELRRQGYQEVQKLCLGGLCSQNCKSSYKLGKKVFRKLREVQSLRIQGDFNDVALPVPENSVDELPLPPTIVGLQSTFDSVWRCLMEQQFGIVGLYGMGGVGKTTLLTQINNKFLDRAVDFDFVIWVVVSKDLHLETIQESIAKKIGLFKESWNNQSLHEKAQEIFKILSSKKFVLFFDDIWEPVDLSQLGVPIPRRPTTSTASKVVFTTREFEVCGQMEAHKSFKVECLMYEDAWKLFEDKVGKEVLDTHPDIPELAETVAKECGGLPLALITVGRAMASKKTPREWEHAIEILRSSASRFSGMETRVFSRLKLSYDFLPSDANRNCILYCSLFPEDYRISIEELIDCWICEGFLDEYEGIGARNQGYSIIRVLVHACLLEEEEEEDNYVKMHDVIRDMALWIASTINKEEEKFLVLAGVGLTEGPKIGMWKDVTRMSLMQNKISKLVESPASPYLLTLFLSSNDLYRVNNDFFQSMTSLRVLNLSSTNPPQHSVFGISKLTCLQHLNLSNSRVERLPIELKYLVKLKCLNLEHTFRLSSIPRQIISNLKMLQILRMFECGLGVRQDPDSILFGDSDVLVEELIVLKSLNVLTVTLLSISAIQRLLSSLDQLQGISIPSICLTKCKHSVSFNVCFLARLRHLKTLHIVDIFHLESLKIDYAGEAKKIRETRGFHCLENVYINCIRLRHVTWLVLAPNLKHLRVDDSGMWEIINMKELREVPDEVMENIVPFSRLKTLVLERTDYLLGIYSGALPFPHLKEITVRGCPRLKKLPFDCSSGLHQRIVIKGEECWWNELQWDDQATQNAFLPCFKSLALV